MHAILNESIFERLKHSDKSAFNIIFETYYDSVFKNIFYKTRDYDLSCDIAQETFIKCWENRFKIDSNKSLYYWLVTIANNLTINHFRHNAIKTKHHDIIKKDNNGTEYSADANFELEQLQQQIDFIVKTYLPKKCQVVFIMSRFEGQSNGEIAEYLNISRKTVENQLYNALSTIRKKMNKTKSASIYTFVLL